MNKITIITPDNIEVEYKLASLPLRAAAAGIDMLIQIIVFALFVVVGIMIIDVENLFATGPDRKEIIVMSVLLVVYGLLMYSYYVVCDIVMKGQTIGKKVYHIRVIRENGEGISIAHAVIREFIRITIDRLGIGIILCFVNKKYKRLGDILASTIVVSEEKSKSDYNDYLGVENIYNFDHEDIELLKDFYSRKSDINVLERKLFEDRYIKFIEQKYDKRPEGGNREAFLQSILG